MRFPPAARAESRRFTEKVERSLGLLALVGDECPLHQELRLIAAGLKFLRDSAGLIQNLVGLLDPSHANQGIGPAHIMS